MVRKATEDFRNYNRQTYDLAACSQVNTERRRFHKYHYTR